MVRKVLEHSSYDAWWQGQAVDKLLGARKLTVPTMLVVGQWNQEDSYGAPAVYRALETQDSANDMVSLVIGPWRHSQVNVEARELGPLWEGDTGRQFRARWMKPFFACHRKTDPKPCDTPRVPEAGSASTIPWEAPGGRTISGSAAIPANPSSCRALPMWRRMMAGRPGLVIDAGGTTTTLEIMGAWAIEAPGAASIRLPPGSTGLGFPPDPWLSKQTDSGGG